jgi:hypothetical protein
MEKEIVRFASRYFFMPSKLFYCQDHDTDKIFFEYSCGRGDKKKCEELLRKNSAISAYLKLIAEKNNKDMLDKEVLEAYWIGNKLLDNISYQDMIEMMNKLTAGKMETEVMKKMTTTVPIDGTPHHSFHVLHIHRLTENTQFLYSKIDKCRISWGKVKKVNDNNLVVTTQPLKFDNKYFLEKPIEKAVEYNKDLIRVKPGDIVAIHWDLAIDILNREQVKNLENYTKKNIDSMNRHLLKK